MRTGGYSAAKLESYWLLEVKGARGERSVRLQLSDQVVVVHGILKKAFTTTLCERIYIKPI